MPLHRQQHVQQDTLLLLIDTLSWVTHVQIITMPVIRLFHHA